MTKQTGSSQPGRTPGVFLTAGWHHLLLLNFDVEPGLLAPYLPQGCELDLFQGTPYVSLVAFQFHDTKVFRIKWPGFTNFPELNLRFYIRCKGERGVCFIREYVPSRLVAGIARMLYNEPYQRARMSDDISVTPDGIRATYTLNDGPNAMGLIVRAENRPFFPDEVSAEHFFKEHELGVGRNRAGQTLAYKVHHPRWRIFPVQQYSLHVDAAGIYGDRFSFLATQEPRSVIFAEGSEIKVFKPIIAG